MLSIDQIDEYLRITGYPDGTDWWVLLPHNRPEFSYGIAGSEHVWYLESGGRLLILHTPSRRTSATLQLEGHFPTALQPFPVTKSQDGRRLYVLEWLGAMERGESRVHAVDLSVGAVTAIHGPLPARPETRLVERPDGRLLMPTLQQGLVPTRLDQRRVGGVPRAGCPRRGQLLE